MKAGQEQEKILQAHSFIRQYIGDFSADFGIVLGTGLGALADALDVRFALPYEQIPHFPVATVTSHKGQLLFGFLSEKPVVMMKGRFHLYEGYTAKQIALPIRVMKLLGIKQLLISNAAGGLNENFAKADLMLIEDHINLMPDNPLTGENLDLFGERFPDMFAPYCPEMLAMATRICQENGISAHKGVYVGVSGPNLETRAEYKFLRTIGADAVGMSTVLEVIAAVHAQIPVLAVSVITDLCTPEALKPVTVEQIIQTAASAEPHLVRLFKQFLQQIQ